MRILGLDISTCTGLCFTHNGTEFATKVINFPKLTGQERLQSIASALEWEVCDLAPDFAVIEGYSYASKFMIVNMVEVGAIVRNTLYRGKVPYYEVSPSSVKKYASAPGNAKKKVVAKHVKEMWGFESSSDDIVDAYILVRIGMAIAKLGRVPSTLVKGIKYESSRVS